MKKFLLLVSVLAIFAGCSGSNPSVDFKQTSGINNSKIVESENLHFRNIDIIRYKLQDKNNRILFYEMLRIDSDYNFNYNPLNNIIYIFNAKKATVVYDDNISLLVQLELESGEVLNVFANSVGVQDFSYVYGFSNYEFKKIAKDILKDSGTRLPSLTKQGLVLSLDSMPLSRWSVAKFFIKPFIYDTRGRMLL